MELNGKKILVVGLGTLGGGVATVRWLVKQGADITVTDLRTRKELEGSIDALGGAAKKIKFVLGRHREGDFMESDAIVLGPGVKVIGNKFLAAAKKKGVPIVNDLTLFLDRVKNLVIAVTGTRGKTTTANWTAHLLKTKYRGVRASGNSSDDALLKLLPRLVEDERTPAVLELSSFQLELADEPPRGPDIAIITNLSRDHLNRHETMRNYAHAKANVFSGQTRKQKLILNFDSPWTKFFLAQKPKARVYGVSLGKLPPKREGLWVDGLTAMPADRGGSSGREEQEQVVVFSENGKSKKVFSGKLTRNIAALGKHNVYNFLASALAAHLMGMSWKAIEKRSRTLPRIALRQEVILREKGLTVVNDSAGTSPEATIAAIRRFSRGGKMILVTGGTDKNLALKGLAREIKKSIAPEDLFLLNGSATKKLILELKNLGYFQVKKTQLFEDLREILRFIKKSLVVSRKSSTVLLFSPGAASFEKFKNEFDRGERFTVYSKAVFQ